MTIEYSLIQNVKYFKSFDRLATDIQEFNKIFLLLCALCGIQE